MVNRGSSIVRKIKEKIGVKKGKKEILEKVKMVIDLFGEVW